VDKKGGEVEGYKYGRWENGKLEWILLIYQHKFYKTPEHT